MISFKEGKIRAYYYYYLDDNECQRTTDSIYIFKKLHPLTSYNIKVHVEDLNGETSEELTKTVTTPQATSIADVCNTGDELSNCLISLYTKDGTNGLYYHDGVGTYTNASLEAGDKSYRYSGTSSSINNYVCLGVDATVEACPANNLYRIIGAFPTDAAATKYQLKLIKNTSIGYYWRGSNPVRENVWSRSTLNTVTLNGTTGTYWQSLGTDIEKVAITNWIVSGVPDQTNKNNAKALYNAEIKTTTPTKYRAKIGLMYISDYMYAASL